MTPTDFYERNDQPRWCSACDSWDEGDGCNCLPLDKVEATTDYLDHNLTAVPVLAEPQRDVPRTAGARESTKRIAGSRVEPDSRGGSQAFGVVGEAGGGIRVQPSPAPLLLDWPAWRLSFSAYAEHLGIEVDPFTDEKLHEMGCAYDRHQINGGD